MIEYNEDAKERVNPPANKPMIVSFSKVLPAAVIHLHFKATRGEADRYGSQMFTFKIQPEMKIISPLFEGVDTIWLFYRRQA